MKVEEIRNVGIVGHGGAGKTILVDAMAFNAGVVNRIGTVEDGTTISDFHAQEIKRQISINTSMLNLSWSKHKINVLDAPGYLDFVGEVHGTLHVADTAVIVVDASSGVEVGTENAWDYSAKRPQSKIFVVNKLDKEDVQFEKIVDEIKSTLSQNTVPVQFPYNSGPAFNSIVDMIRGKLLVYATDGSGKYTEEEIPADFADKYDELRLAFMESIIEHDDELMDKYLNDEQVSEDDLKRVMAQACRQDQLFPVVCVSGRNNIGVNRLMDVIVNFGACPSDHAPITCTDSDGQEVKRNATPDEPLCAFVFKTLSLPHVGDLSFVKVISGTLKVGSDVINCTKKGSERISSLFTLNGKERYEVQKIDCGDMGAIIKLKATFTNDTLAASSDPVSFSPVEFPEPMIRGALVAKNKGEEDKVGMGLSVITAADPTLTAKFDPELKQTIVSGQGEVQLDIMVDQLKNRFSVDVELFEPRIPYRETITKKVDVRRKYKKQTGGRGQYGDVHIEIKPRPRGQGFEFVNNIVGGVIPTKFIPAVEKGVVGAMTEGFVVGARVVDVSVRLFDGSYHAVDSSDLAFQVAGAQAFKLCMEKANPIVLEPIYKLEVRVPEEYMGTIMGDVSGRRGKVLGMEMEGAMQVINAEVPLAELYKYSSNLRSMTQGRGTHRRSFARYEPVPREIQAKLVEAYQAEKEAEG